MNIGKWMIIEPVSDEFMTLKVTIRKITKDCLIKVLGDIVNAVLIILCLILISLGIMFLFMQWPLITKLMLAAVTFLPGLAFLCMTILDIVGG